MEFQCVPRREVTAEMRVRCSLGPNALAELAVRQINHLFPDGFEVDVRCLVDCANGAMKRLEHCFSHISNKYFFDGDSAVLDHLLRSIRIWLILWQRLHQKVASRSAEFVPLNKALHGCDSISRRVAVAFYCFRSAPYLVEGRIQIS